METLWFYAEGEQRRGPVTLDEVVRALLAVPDPHRVVVWHEGMAGWQEAGSIPEIRGRLPPPVVGYQPNPGAGSPELFTRAAAIARFYRRLVLLVGLQIPLGVFQVLAQPAMQGGGPLALTWGVVVNLALIGVIVVTAVTAYKLAAQLGSAPIAWAIAMFVPCINVLVLLALSSKAQSWCRRYGVKVGLLGPWSIRRPSWVIV
jgi:hypothetical protein